MVDVTPSDPIGSEAGAEPALGESRSRVLSVLQDDGGPLDAGEVAGRVRLHVNTTRFHLDGLVEADLVERRTEERGRPGRPRALYVARSGRGRAGRRNYRLLAEILASYLAAEIPKPAEAARGAGEAWGRYLAERPPPFRRTEAAAATDQLVRVLDDIGFAPEHSSAAGEQQVLLRHCPFREIAEKHRDVVCSIHLGLMQGLLAELASPVEVAGLDPFVEPSLCVTHLDVRNDAGSDRPDKG